MWSVEDSAETMAMNPWNGVTQSQVWAGMGRGNGGQPTFSGLRVGDARGGRAWMEQPQVQAPAAAQWNAQTSGQPAAQWTTVPPNQASVPQAPSWTIPQQAWGGAAGSQGGTYAEQAKKNVVPMGARGQGPTARFDQPQSWGGLKVDQQTPWDTGSTAGQVIHGSDPKTDWGNSVAPSGSRWTLGNAANGQWTVAHSANPSDWTHHRHDPTGTAHWSTPQTHSAAVVQTGVPSGSWGQPQPNISSADQYDPNPQTPGPWVAPQPTEMNNDMMWHDPNPKQKKVQRDTGTSVWGDPSTQQGEIKRWKDAELDDYSNVLCAAPSGGDWSSIPVSAGPLSSNTSPPSTASGWGDSSTTAASHTSSDGTDRWGVPPQTSGWGDQSKVKTESSVDNSQASEMISANGPSNNAAAASSVIESMRSDGPPYSSLTQQITDYLRIAVSKGLIDVSLINQPLPQGALVALNALIQKLPRLDQLQQEYNQLTRSMTTPAQKMEADRLMVEIQELQNEILQCRNTINQEYIKNRSSQNVASTTATSNVDRQSRLNQWKQANSSDASEKITPSISDTNVPALVASAQNMSLDDKVEWKRGTLDWSPPSSAAGERSVVAANTNEGSNVPDKEESDTVVDKTTSSNSQSIDGTSTPPVDDGPQEFVPGKKWEWRDPNKVAEDPNATPGNCKPNPLLSSSNAYPSGFGGNVGQNYLQDITMNKNAFMGWNGIPNTAGYISGDMWNSRSRPPSAVGQSFVPRMHNAQVPQNSFSRSVSNPTQQPFQYNTQWILIQSQGINEKQLRMVCQKVGQVLQYFYPPGSSCACVKFADPVDAVVQRLKAEIHFIQLKILTELEVERLLKMQGIQGPMVLMGSTAAAAVSGWSAVAAPSADPSTVSWAFGGGAAAMASDMMPQQPQQQQHIFHNDDLTRPF
ncbi:hypothetical protein AB6A40_002178 [Gnathostoma spinigerum]|uniref:GW182 middle domain-containing protein n=1 Tax=Gnathostoma spinigerum TaxID=75299 RepID=A0ABD6EDP0_9BILA